MATHSTATITGTQNEHNTATAFGRKFDIDRVARGRGGS